MTPGQEERLKAWVDQCPKDIEYLLDDALDDISDAWPRGMPDPLDLFHGLLYDAWMEAQK